jgi:IS30 family transposase
MVERKRGLSAAERAELWRRWRAGESLSDIARALCRMPGSVFGFVASSGGISPPARRRRAGCLTLVDREELSRGLRGAESLRGIAARLARPVSTVSRGVNRNGGVGRYRAADAEVRAWTHAKRPKLCKLAVDAELQQIVASKLAQNWSPEQISGWMKQRYPDRPTMRISHETTYRSLFIQARGVFKKELQSHLRTRRKMRRAKSATTEGQQRGRIIDAVSIRERPAEVEDRAVPGHWEGDLISGSSNSHIATLVERRSRFTMLVKVGGKDTNTVVEALRKQIVNGRPLCAAP